MITITEHALLAMNFNPVSPLGAVQHVRELVMDGSNYTAGAGTACINKLLGTNLTRNDLVAGVEDTVAAEYEMMVAQGVAEVVVKNVGQPLDEAVVLANSKARVARLMSAPQHQWMFAKAEPTSYGGATTNVAVAAGIEMKVAIKADGSIKKGGKELLAAELYKKHVLESATPVDNQGFIAILVKELGMTKSGATTYNYNMKKKFGGKIEPKKKS